MLIHGNTTVLPYHPVPKLLYLLYITSVADPDPYDLGLPDTDPFVRGTDPAPDPDPSIIKQKK